MAYYPYSHIFAHIIKTTLELPDDLLIAAKQLAVQHRTTFRAIVEHALRQGQELIFARTFEFEPPKAAPLEDRRLNHTAICHT